MPLTPLTLNELKTQMSKLKHDSSVWAELKDILFDNSGESVHEIEKVEKDIYKSNFILTRFEHLFDYEAQYHSYLVAKILANYLYHSPQKTSYKQLFTQGGAFDYRNNFK